jgi:hypothetical protein
VALGNLFFSFAMALLKNQQLLTAENTEVAERIFRVIAVFRPRAT